MKLIIAIVTILVLTSCGESTSFYGQNGKDGQNGNNGKDGVNGANGADYVSQYETKYAGFTFKGDCTDNSVQSYSFGAPNSIVHKVSISTSGNNCRRAAALVLQRVGTFVVNGLEATINYSAAYVTALKQDLVDQLNSSEACGFSDWTLAIPKDLTGNECLGEELQSGVFSQGFADIGADLSINALTYVRQ